MNDGKEGQHDQLSASARATGKPEVIDAGTLHFASLTDVAVLIQSKRVSPVELTQSCSTGSRSSIAGSRAMQR